MKSVSHTDHQSAVILPISRTRARVFALLVVWAVSAVFMPLSGWSAEHDNARGSAERNRPPGVPELFPVEREHIMTSFAHLRNATVGQIADSILILERNGRFPEAQELLRQFVEGLVGINLYDPHPTEQRVDEHSVTLKVLRDQLSRQNDRFLEMMRQGQPRSDAQRHEYQTIVDQILASRGQPYAADAPLIESRLQMLELLLEERARGTRQ